MKKILAVIIVAITTLVLLILICWGLYAINEAPPEIGFQNDGTRLNLTLEELMSIKGSQPIRTSTVNFYSYTYTENVDDFTGEAEFLFDDCNKLIGCCIQIKIEDPSVAYSEFKRLYKRIKKDFSFFRTGFFCTDIEQNTDGYDLKAVIGISTDGDKNYSGFTIGYNAYMTYLNGIITIFYRSN